MAKEGQTFEQWLHAAKVPPERLNDQQRAVLQATFEFLQHGCGDYSSSRIASHFLLHCGLGLKLAQIARLVGISARSAFRHEKLSAMQVAQQIQHRFHGRPYGKLLPRHAGSIAEFLFTHPEATRDELLDFIARTWEFRVSRVALWEFLKKYGLDRASLEEAQQTASREEEERVTIEVLEARLPGGLVPVVPDHFFLPRPSTPELSCCGPKCSLGSTRPASASATTTVRSRVVS
jgi:transposase